MTMDQVEAGMTEILRDVLARDDVTAAPDLTAAEICGPDPYKRVDLIMAAEERFGVRFSSREADGFRRLGDLMDVVAGRETGGLAGDDRGNGAPQPAPRNRAIERISTQMVNDVARRGFVIGWEPLKLGNALSCLATLFVLSRRTGIPTIFPYIDRYRSLFARETSLSRVYVPSPVNEEALGRLVERLHPLLEQLPFLTSVEGTSFDEMGRARVKGVVWFSQYEGSIVEWERGDAERHLRAFCRRGNGVVLSGSYWRQYTDMRGLAREGEALRKHLGPLNPSLLTRPRSGKDPAEDPIRVGLHIRQGDYRDWHGGRFFFELEGFRAAVRAMHDELGDRPHEFELVSDQSFDTDFFSGLPVHRSMGDLFQDFAKLSECDVVVGPPSTFSTWAAFCGRAKRVVLTKQRMADRVPLIGSAVDIPFPTGSYLPGDDRGGPI